MSSVSILEKVQQVVATALDRDPASIEEGHSFRSDLGADSLDSVEIIMAIEDEFGIEFDEDSARQIDTIGQLVRHIEEALAQNIDQPA